MIEFLNNWKELIIAFLKNYPLAGAILGAIAIYSYFELKKQKINEERPILNVLIVFAGWVILVPLIGLIFKIIEKIWSYIETTIPFIVKIVSKVSQIYEKHPILVLSIVAIGFISYFILNKKIKKKWLRIIVIIIAVIVAIFISSPIADLFSSDNIKEEKKENYIEKDSSEIKLKPQPEISLAKENFHDSIFKFNRDWMNSYLVRDSIGILQNYTDSTLGLFSGYQAIIGKDSLLSYWFTKRNSGIQQIQLKIIIVDKQPLSDIAIENGTYNLITDNGQIQESGEYFRIWKKHEAKWIQQKDIWYLK